MACIGDQSDQSPCPRDLSINAETRGKPAILETICCPVRNRTSERIIKGVEHSESSFPALQSTNFDIAFRDLRKTASPLRMFQSKERRDFVASFKWRIHIQFRLSRIQKSFSHSKVRSIQLRSTHSNFDDLALNFKFFDQSRDRDSPLPTGEQMASAAADTGRDSQEFRSLSVPLFQFAAVIRPSNSSRILLTRRPGMTS
jgi:hypothetical protein